MGNYILNSFKISSILIGTVVGAGLASGKEIYQFFSIYGQKSFIGFIICFLIYIIIGNMICKIANEKKLDSYGLLINEVCGKVSSKILNLFTGLYYLFSSAIIFAASGSIINQFFGIHKIYGTIIMLLATLVILRLNTKGLFLINAISVPVMITVIIVMFILFELFFDPVNIQTFLTQEVLKEEIRIHNNIILSSFLYGGFNILSSTGVLAPLSNETKDRKSLNTGILVGSFILVLISLILNYLILSNMPYVAKYDIPLLYIAKIFGKPLQIIILVLIWTEMLSTEVSSVYSLSKNLSNKYGWSFLRCVFIIVMIAIPISILGFSKLIAVLYPLFGFLSLIFMAYIIKYKIKNKI